MPTLCDTVGCPSHLGKFDSCESEAAWELSRDFPDRSTGSVEAYGGHFSLIEIEDVPVLHRLDMGTPDERRVALWPGAYLVTEDEQGFVDVTHFPPEDVMTARAVMDQADRRYADWLGDDE